MLFRKTDKSSAISDKKQAREPVSLSVLAKGTNLLGTLISDGNIDFDGNMDGNIRCYMLTVRKSGNIQGDVDATTLHVYGKINGLIKAKNVYLHSGCHVEGIIIHETISMEEGAFLDGKCKRSDKEEDGGNKNHRDRIIVEEEIIEPITAPIRLIS